MTPDVALTPPLVLLPVTAALSMPLLQALLVAPGVALSLKPGEIAARPPC